MIFHVLLNSIARKRTQRPPNFFRLFDRFLNGEYELLNHIGPLIPGTENPGHVTSRLGPKMADRKWLSVLLFGTSSRGIKVCFLLKFGDDISSRFGDSGRNFENSRWRPVAILDFSEKKKNM